MIKGTSLGRNAHGGGETGGVVRRRDRDAAAAAQDPQSPADDRAIAELLERVRDVRTTLAIDLSAAAGALEEDRPEVARDILTATTTEVAAIGARSPRRRTRPVTPRHRGRRVLLALPLVPLVGGIAMTTAAAMGWSGITTSHHHRHPTTQVTATTTHHPVVAVHSPSTAVAHKAAATTLHRLEHVVKHDPRASQVLAVAADLHEQLTAMIATATNNPAGLHVVRQLLALEQHVLEMSKVPGTQLALEASREIARLLAITPDAKINAPSPTARATAASHSSPRATATTSPTSTTAKRATPTPNSTSSRRVGGSTHSNPFFGRGLFGLRQR